MNLDQLWKACLFPLLASCAVNIQTAARMNDMKLSEELRGGHIRREGDCAVAFHLKSGVVVQVGQVKEFAGHQISFTSNCQGYTVIADVIDGQGDRSFYTDESQILRNHYGRPANKESAIVR